MLEFASKLRTQNVTTYRSCIVLNLRSTLKNSNFIFAIQKKQEYYY